ncbi:ABC transporter permease [Parasulfitobacter algicola]|uniref:ABC transporter permease n=1 Tax=Parasulfitobacter algicola TaxID=2614809 RepID=A0ABX2J0Y2_9RHOB|nr:ABC transporter permease [Sulfitobacter algicola]NSX56818.1 ABC transporter permease [Sulfitobacter algicola]
MSSILKRVLGLVVVLLGISLITFTVSHFAPGDKAMAIAHARYPGEQGFAPEILQSIRDELHLEASFWEQYLRWLGAVLQGDFGVSYNTQSSVWSTFVGSIGETVTLSLTALVFGLAGAFALAALAVRRPGSLVDRLAIIVASIGSAMPIYWLSLLLILVFAVHLDWVPAYGTGTLAHLVLPTLALAFWLMASQTRLLRSFILDAYDQPFIETLRLRGISEAEIFFRHVLRHAMLPALTMIGLDFALLLEGAVIVEILFARSGLGALLATSVLSRDLPMVMLLVMFFATTYVVINTLIDIVQMASDPRQRQGGQPTEKSI